MKLILFAVLVAVLVWLLRRGFGTGTRPPPADRAAPETLQPMLACAQCGIHLPRDEALPGRGGVFCSEAHRSVYEREHGDP